MYQGDAFPWLRNKFVVTDHCLANLMTVERGDNGWELVPWFKLDGNERINSIDADHDGELIISGFSGRIYRVEPGA